MKKTIYTKFDKTLIMALPVVEFPGRIITILTAGEAERAVDYLLTQPILGIDTETRPSFRKGEKHKVALLQVSDRDICFLFRLNMLGFVPCLVELLSDPAITKVGLSLRDDFMMLRGRRSFTPGGCIDLQEMAKLFGIEDMSLQKLFANIFGQRISKTAQLSNWEADTLTQSQKVYAATDAYACILLYEELLRLRQSGNYTLIQPENEPK